MRRLRSAKVLRNERGATAITVAILITVLVGFTAYVVDIGYAYEMRRQLQSAADATALATMIEKIQGADDDGVLTVARTYAELNDNIDKSESLVLLTDPPHTEITEDFVKIGVRKPAYFFFAPIFGISEKMVYAQARARRVYVTGAKGAVPWGVATIRASDMMASINGSEDYLTKNSDDLWSALISAPAAPDKDGYSIDLTIFNSQDFPLVFSGVGSAVVHAPGDLVTDVRLADNMLAPGYPTTLIVESATKPQRARVGGTIYPGSAFSGSAGHYEAPIVAPDLTEPLQTFAVDIRVDNIDYNNAARLIVRSENSPIEDISFGQLHFGPGGGSTLVTVKMRDFEYEKLYDLKLVQDPDAGNFNALDFRYIYHPLDYTWNHGENQNTQDYYENLSGSYNGVIDIGDIIATQPGGLATPKTTDALDERIGDCNLSWDEWKVEKPADCGKLVTVPIIEHIERVTGKTDVYVYAIAEFFLESYAKVGNEKVNITGRFIRYSKTGTHSDTPPDSKLYMETVRLEQADY